MKDLIKEQLIKISIILLVLFSIRSFGEEGATLIEIELNEGILERVVDQVLKSLDSSNQKLDLSKILRKVGPKAVYLPESSRLLPENGYSAILGYYDDYSLYLTNLKLKLDVAKIVKEKKIQLICRKTGECEVNLNMNVDFSFDLAKGKKNGDPKDFVRFSNKPYELSINPELKFSFNLKDTLSTDGVIDFNNKERPFNLTEHIENLFSVNFRESRITFTKEDEQKLQTLTSNILYSEGSNIPARLASYFGTITNSISSTIESSVGNNLVILVGELLTEKLVPYIDDELNLAYNNFTKTSYEKSPYLHVPFSNRGINLSIQETIDSSKIRNQMNQLKDDFTIIESELMFLKAKKLDNKMPLSSEELKSRATLKEKMGDLSWHQMNQIAKTSERVLEGDQEVIAKLETQTMRKLSFKNKYQINEATIRILKSAFPSVSPDISGELYKIQMLQNKYDSILQKNNHTEGELKDLQRKINLLKVRKEFFNHLYKDREFLGLNSAKYYLKSGQEKSDLEKHLSFVVEKDNAKIFLNMIKTIEQYMPSRMNIDNIESLKMDFIRNVEKEVKNQRLVDHIRSLILENINQISDALWFYYNINRFKNNSQSLDSYISKRMRYAIIEGQVNIDEVNDLKEAVSQNKFSLVKEMTSTILSRLSGFERAQKEKYLNEILKWVLSNQTNYSKSTPPKTYIDIFNIKIPLNSQVREKGMELILNTLTDIINENEKSKIMDFLINEDPLVSPEKILTLQHLKSKPEEKDRVLSQIANDYLKKIDTKDSYIKTNFEKTFLDEVNSTHMTEKRLQNPQGSSFTDKEQFLNIVHNSIPKIETILEYFKNAKTAWSKDQIDELSQFSLKINEAIYYLHASEDEKNKSKEMDKTIKDKKYVLNFALNALKNLNKEKITLKNRNASDLDLTNLNEKIVKQKDEINKLNSDIKYLQDVLENTYESYIWKMINSKDPQSLSENERLIISKNILLKRKLIDLKNKITSNINDKSNTSTLNQLNILLKLNGPEINTQMSFQHCSGNNNLPKIHIIHPNDEVYNIGKNESGTKQKGHISTKIHLDSFNKLIEEQLLGKTICINKNSTRTCDNAKAGDVLVKLNFPAQKELMPKATFNGTDFVLNFQNINIQIMRKSGSRILDYFIGKPLDITTSFNLGLTPVIKDIKGDGTNHLFLQPKMKLTNFHGNNKASKITSKFFGNKLLVNGLLSRLENIINNSSLDLTPPLLSSFFKIKLALKNGKNLKFRRELEMPSQITDDINIDFKSFHFDPDTNQFNIQFNF